MTARPAGLYTTHSNLLVTVIDFQMNTTAVVRALDDFRNERWEDVRRKAIWEYQAHRGPG